MKFLHISDLHIGKSVNGFSMLEEQECVLKQIVGYIRSERPCAVVIAGDVYDRAVPGVEAVRLFDDFLTDIAHEDAAVLLISGNHDSPDRLNFASRLLSDKRVYLRGAFDGKLTPVEFTDEYGPVNFWLLPFIKPLTVRGLFEGREIESYGDAVLAALETADIDYTARNVIAAHQFFTRPGVTITFSESEINPVGGLDAVDAGVFSRFDYAALGHLHGAQKLGAENFRYAGSPLKYSFSECRQQKSVSMIELKAKGDVSVTLLPLTPLRDMREIKGPIAKLMSEEIASMGNREDYLRVTLTDEDEIVDPMGKLRGVYPNIMALDFENSRTNIDLASVSPDPAKAERISPFELFCDFFLEVSGSVMSAEQEKIARKLFEAAEDKI